MADAHQAAANRHLRMLFDAGTVVGKSDGQLLDLFATRRDETAFTALIERHGPMVQRVCGEILGNHHDAEDAFQATFLILARHAGSIRRRDSLANWLYGVALRVSTCARSASARRRRHERNWAAVSAARTSNEGESRDDFGPLLYVELGRLPERFRVPMVICDLEGRTYEEAARLLRCPVGTIKSRLATARRRLRQRLERSGIVAVPARLAETTIQTVMRGDTGGAVPVSVARLVEGVLKVMFLNRLSVAATVLIVVAALATGASGWAWQAKGRPAAVEAKTDNPPQTKPGGRATEPQAPARASNLTNLAGRVVDEQGKPVADARVFFFAPPPLEGKVEPVELRTQTDAGGQFHLEYPPLGLVTINEVHVWAYRPGSAITAVPSYLSPLDLVLRKPQPRTLKLEGPDGRPIAGAVVSPRVIHVAARTAATKYPRPSPASLALTTGPDGQASIDYLAGSDDLVAVHLDGRVDRQPGLAIRSSLPSAELPPG